jgi:hypothetical protein
VHDAPVVRHYLAAAGDQGVDRTLQVTVIVSRVVREAGAHHRPVAAIKRAGVAMHDGTDRLEIVGSLLPRLEGGYRGPDVAVHL